MGGVKLPVGAVPGDRVGGDGVGCEGDQLDRAWDTVGSEQAGSDGTEGRTTGARVGMQEGPAAVPGDSMAATPLTVMRTSGGE